MRAVLVVIRADGRASGNHCLAARSARWRLRALNLPVFRAAGRLDVTIQSAVAARAAGYGPPGQPNVLGGTIERVCRAFHARLLAR